MRLTPNERTVLCALAGVGLDLCLPFRPLMDETKLTRSEVRRACRSLSRKGLASFSKGLWTDDGEPAGSGYGLSFAGVDLACTFDHNPVP